MKVLLACEKSGTVRRAFRASWHDAWSCDLRPADDGGEHIQGDALEAVKDDWDLVIAFPPCTHLASSGAGRFREKRADGRQQAAIRFFMAFTQLYHVRHVAIENPVGIMSTLYRKPDQIIQPYQHGHPESKRTCLWLKGLPLLRPTAICKLPACGYWRNQTPSGQNKLGPSADRADIRSKTYEGIARAMALQWSGLDKLTLV